MTTRTRTPGIAALAVILLAGALSATWAFLVPIFQAPDEPAHFDYAISIYSARRLIALADGRPDWIVSPYTRYLLKASDFERIAWHSSMRVPPGYSSKVYYARVDAGAPSLYQPAASDGRISYIVPLYPFGFYALEALWMGAASLFTQSIVAIFFAARLLCVFLLMIGLYFSYRTAINLGLPRWTSVALIAAIGLFPLTSFVSSYVQPDNLSYALISASLFFATELRSSALRLPVVLALGISLGLLTVTKYQFFLVAVVAIAPLFVVRFMRARPPASRSVPLVGALLAPTLVLLSIQHWVVGRLGAGGHAVNPLAGEFTEVMQAVASGALPTLKYLFATSVWAFIDFFISGNCAMTYWQVVGWFDTPVIIVNNAIESWIRGAIALATIAVAVTLAFYFTRNTWRSARASLRGHARAALETVARDPVLNAYLCFVAFMFALYVLSADAFTAEGRHWYPLIFPAFLCFVWYAPRCLSRRSGVLTAALTLTLLFYSLCAASFALRDVGERYYGPQLARYIVQDPPRYPALARSAGALWPITSAEYHVIGRDSPTTFALGSRLLAWGYVLPAGGVAESVAVVVDSRFRLPVLWGQYAYVHANPFGNPADAYSGFYANLATTGLREGAHVVAAYARAPGRNYTRIAPARLFFLTTGGARFSSAFLGALERAPTVDGALNATGTCRGVASIAQGVQTVAAGALLLVTGSVSSQSARQYDAIWLFAGGRPFETRYNPRNGSFEGTIPTERFASGAHRLVAYAVRADGSGSNRISEATAFEVTQLPGGKAFLANPPRACADPLEELAGI